jgi:hypothetical protein
MTTKQTPAKKPSAKEKARLEHERFLELAKELGADEETPALQGVLRGAVSPARATRKK